MIYLYLLLAAVLMCGTIACLCMAAGLDQLTHVKEGEPWPPLSQRFSGRWLAASVLCIAAVVGVFVGLIFPAGAVEGLEEARELTRETFREKLGKEPDTLELQDHPSAPYTGTARLGDEVWDVVVTRTGPQGASRTVTTECTLTPRAK